MCRAAVSNSARSGTNPTISLHVLRFRFHLHHVIGAVERRLLGVDEIHRDLSLSVHFETESFHVAQAARRSTDGFGDRLRDAQVRRGSEVDVVCDEERARADRHRAGRWVNLVRAEIRSTIRRAGVHLVPNALELTAANIGQVLTIGTGRGALVQKDWNLELLAHALAERSGEDDAILHRRALERNERDDVRRAHPRMLAGVVIQVDVLPRRFDSGERRVHRVLDGNDKSDDGAVVRLIR